MRNSDLDFLCSKLGTEYVARNISKHKITQPKLLIIAKKFKEAVKTGKNTNLAGLFFKLIREERGKKDASF